MTKLILFFSSIAFHLISFGQTYNCPIGQGIVVEDWREEIVDSHFIGSAPDGSILSYCPEFFSLNYGGSYTLNYLDQGGSGMDAYPNVIIGSAKINGNWQPGNITLTGMPVTINNIPDNMSLEWKVSQENAFDSDDKWMASINFIFDNTGSQNSEPLSEDRDYDLVIKSVSHNFTGDDLTDNPITSGDDIFWYYARESNGSLKPYIVTIDGISYTYAVRYKFFQNSGDQDNKVHLKFIPYGPNGAPAITKINVKEIINVTKSFIPFANLPNAQLVLANSKVALNNAWLKSINAGYEVYTGQSILKTEKFKIFPQGTLNDLDNEISDASIKIFPNPVDEYITIMGVESENANIDLYDYTGKLILSKQLSPKQNLIDIKCLESGMYWIQVSTPEEIKLFEKIIVSNRF